MEFESESYLVEVALFGGWKSPWTSLHYEHNLLVFKRELSKTSDGGPSTSKDETGLHQERIEILDRNVLDNYFIRELLFWF